MGQKRAQLPCFERVQHLKEKLFRAKKHIRHSKQGSRESLLMRKKIWAQWHLKLSESLQKIDLNLYTDQNLEGHPENFALNPPFWIVNFGGRRGDDKAVTSNF